MPTHSEGFNVSLVAESQSVLRQALHTLEIGVLFIAAAALISCGTPGHATLNLTAPSTATKDTPFTVTVNALYQGKPDLAMNGVIHFTSSDPAAVLPIDYQFTVADAGSHTWANGFKLSTPGSQTISGEIHDASGINGSATISVSP